MRAQHLQQTRPAWYDRSPLTIGLLYQDNGIPPHAQTQRVTYTAPANRKALLEASTTICLRLTAAAPVGLVRMSIAGTYDGATGAWQPAAIMLDNAVGALGGFSQSQQSILQPGNNVRGFTEDQSTGGTVQYIVTAKLTEYDN